MRWPWMIVAWAVATPVVMLLALRWGRRHSSGEATVALAHTLRLAGTERFAVLRRRQLLVTVVRAGFVLLALVGVFGVTARPTVGREIEPDRPSRDILLCLDVSDSMDDANVEILEAFTDLVRQLEGDRIGLVIFNTIAVPKFPLTDDLDFVLAQLEEGADAIRNFEFGWDRATVPPNPAGSSLIADGLASCTQRFDRLDEDRPRSIVFATDNDPQGEQVFTDEEAFALAADAGIRVYGINPFDSTHSFEDVTTSTGGRYWQFDDVDVVEGIVDDVLSQEAALLDDEPADVIVSDRPQFWIAVAALGVLGLVATAGWSSARSRSR